MSSWVYELLSLGGFIMKVLLVNGSPHEKGCVYTALSEISGQLEKNGVESEIFQIGTEPVRGCIACGACSKLGRCAFDDDVCNRLLGKLIEADGVVIGSPVYYAGPNGALCSVLDRAFYASQGRLAHKPAAAVASCRRGGASATFDRLNKYFTISRMPVVSSQYWNSIHGTCAEEAKQDLEGLQTMRTLADSMAWMLRCIEKSAEEKPKAEAPVKTNFIR